MSQYTADRLAVAATLVIAVAIVILSLIPQQATPDAPGNDKLHHFMAYAALAFPICAARPRVAIWMVPLAITLGGTIELIQPHFGRHAEWGDFLANSAGALTGALVARVTHRMLLRRHLRVR